MNTLDVLNSIRSVLDFYWYSTIIFDGFTGHRQTSKPRPTVHLYSPT